MVTPNRKQLVSQFVDEKSKMQKLKISVPMGQGVVGFVALSGIPLIVNDPYSDSRFDPKFDKKNNFITRNLISLPVRDHDGKVAAVIQCVNGKSSAGFGPQDTTVLSVLGVQAGITLHNAKLYDDAMRTQQKIELLLYVSKTVNEKLDLDHVFSSIMERAKEVMNVQRATLFLLDEERDELWSKLVMDGGVIIRVPTNAGFVGHAYSSGSVLNIPDAYEDPRFNTSVDSKTGFRTKAVLCAPVFSYDRKVIAVTQVVNKKDGTEFDAMDEQLLKEFSATISVSVTHCQLYSQTQQMKEYLESVLRSISNIVLSIGKDGTLVSCNKPLQELGLDSSVVYEAHYSEWVPPQLLVDIDYVFERSKPVYVTNSQLALGQGQPTYNYNVVPLAKMGENSGVVLVLEDVTATEQLGRYVSPVVKDAVSHQNSPRLEGQAKRVSVLFADLRGYTSISEALSAEKVVELLNEFFSVMVNEIVTEHGILDKYIGDALMAVFGLCKGTRDDAKHSVLAALNMHRALNLLNKRRALAGKALLGMGIGVSTGECICGNIGSKHRLEYTVIGDTVNLASRLEALTKLYHVNTLISQRTYEEVADFFHVREVDTVLVAGKSQETTVYEVLGTTYEELSTTGEVVLDHYPEALATYKQGKFEEAAAGFDLCARAGDQLSALMRDRCRELLANPPQQWSGAFRIEKEDIPE